MPHSGLLRARELLHTTPSSSSRRIVEQHSQNRPRSVRYPPTPMAQARTAYAPSSWETTTAPPLAAQQHGSPGLIPATPHRALPLTVSEQEQRSSPTSTTRAPPTSAIRTSSSLWYRGNILGLKGTRKNPFFFFRLKQRMLRQRSARDS